MASIAAEVALHCMICYEEFSTRERPPVVLPCGHTYVCIVCAKRLKRCMECREPLFWNPPRPANVNMNLNSRSPAPSRYAARGRYSPGPPHTPPHPSYTAPIKEEPVALPLPKNTVLMDMIESAERQARLLKEELEKGGEEGSSETRKDEESTSMLEPTLAGMSAFVGSCGTYAVREPSGLAVLPFDPNKQHHTEEKKAEEPREPFIIQEGQTVQVTGQDEGVYKLARRAGYIVATVNQLVKVGGPLEKSCQLEGMLQSVTRKQQELQKELDEVNRLVNGLGEKIKLEQEQPENHPVISAPKQTEPPLTAAGVNDENDAAAAITHPATPPSAGKSDSLLESPVIGLGLTESTDSTEVELGEHRLTPVYPQPLHNTLLLHSPAHSCPMPDSNLDQPFIDGQSTGLPRYRINSDDDIIGLHGLNWGFGCGSALFGERLLGDSENNVMALSFDESLVEDAEALGAQGRRAAPSAAQASSLRSGSFDGVNFRTGLSGHGGLTQARSKASPMSRPHQVRMMSEHRGIAHTRATPPQHGGSHVLKQRTSPHTIGDHTPS